MREPAWDFIEELKKPLHTAKPVFWRERAAGDNALSLADGICVRMDFDDRDGVLETALADFERFCRVLEINARNEKAVSLVIERTETGCGETFRFIVQPGGMTLQAAGPEGVRRGLVCIEEGILAAGAPVLPYQRIEKRPFIRTRLSRCFFGPIKRPPMNRDELEDDVNYYPDEYLNRLAHEGVNALWLTITFRDTVPVTVLPGFGRRADVHLPKLRETVKRCARYGIRIFVFFIEPTAFIDERDHSRYADIRLYEKDYPELMGSRQGGLTCFCPNSDLARSFLYEASNNLFSEVPGLGGMIDISVGERLTHCASGYSDHNNCPRCAGRQPSEVLADVLTSLQRGMRDADPDAEFISWPYSQYLLWGADGTAEAAGKMPESVILQHNFESSGLVEQLGRVRRADDYWLSYTGPSELFRRTALEAQKNDTRIFAKLQVGCSHEVASVTHVPVPGILYDKYKRMRELGVSGAMQSWYFGNYPSLMTRAAGRLSFEPWNDNKSDFLYRLALPDWGPYSRDVARAWELFQEAYARYPVYHVFGYYAPVHDGPVWPLYLKPVNQPLIANWKYMPEFPVHGDRIGECLQDAFSLEEALLLTNRMRRTWQQGLKILEKIEPAFEGDTDRLRDINTARALGILFASCCNILRFYQLREEMADLTGAPALACLRQLEGLIHAEKKNSRTLAECCMTDPALGFNSEHEGFRFYPEKLSARIGRLEEVLDTDLPQTEERLRQGLLPFPVYTGQEPDRPVYVCRPESGVSQPGEQTAKGMNGHFSVSYTDESIIWRVGFSGKAQPFELHLMSRRLWPERVYRFDPRKGSTTLKITDTLRPPQIIGQLPTKVTDEGTVEVRLPFTEIERPAAHRFNPLRFNIIIDGGWVNRPVVGHRLAQSSLNPDRYGWLQFAD
ncbi:MAG: hypothetical protein PHZ09_05215 [Eubacteriales bacterium]|nr:hypothetical protein [Eubacteriales bacterium]